MVAAVLVGALIAGSSAWADSAAFTSLGPNPFTVPAGISAVHVVLVGAPGGHGGDAGGAQGGTGSQAIADLAVTAGQQLDAVVGGAGASGSLPAGGLGGINGGGAGGNGSQVGQTASYGGGGGGGATDLRPHGGDLSTRIIVASGGGGGAPHSFGGGGGPGDANGGSGAGNCGTPGAGGKAGTDTQGGAGGASGGGLSGGVGSLGQGGAGGAGLNNNNAPGDGAGGGGGGAYGGGGGHGSFDACSGAGGGGGGGSMFGAGTSNTLVYQGSNQASATINWMPPAASSPDVVISQVYDFQNDLQAPYKDGFVELFNRGSSPVNVNNWAVQLAGPQSSNWSVSGALPNMSVAPGGYLLIGETGNYSHPETLPTPDATVQFENFTDSEKVALTDSTNPLQGNCPTRTSDLIDFVGVGPNADCFVGSGPGSALDSADAATRVGHGCIDTEDNTADFTAAGPDPHNSSSAIFDCSVPLNQTPPTVTGTPEPGQQLTCTHGTWQHAATLDYQWVQMQGGNPIPIGGETNQTYTVKNTDVGFGIACEDVAMDGSGDTETAVSHAKIAEPGPPDNTAPPHINGQAIVGHTISCTTGTWSNGPLHFAYRWLRDGAAMPGQTTVRHQVTATDRESTLSCQVTASNDVGSGLPATSAGVFAVQGKPTNVSPPTVTLADTGSRPTDKVATCHPGRWRDDARDYDFRFQHSAGDVIDSTGATHQVTPDDLGEEITCTVFVHNAAGTSSQTSDPVLVPLPAPKLEQGGVHMYTAGGEVNEFDPVNLLATSDGLQKDLDAAQQQRVQRAYDNFRADCKQRNDLSPGPPSTDPRSITDRAERNKALCELILSTPTSQIRIGPDGVRIESDPNKCVLGVDDPCAVLPIPMPAPFGLPPGTVDSGVVPQKILWDVNSDGKVDATCPGNAPVLRSIYDRGYYNVRAVLVLPGSADTGEYPSIALTFNHYADGPPPNEKLLRYVASGVPAKGHFAGAASVSPVELPSVDKLGFPRKTQPFACRTSLTPPPDPALPCTDEGYIGQVHVEGNLCPISLRRIPKPELDQIRANDPDLYDLLTAENQSLGLAHDRGRAPPGARPARAAAFPTSPAGAFNLAMQQFASPTPVKYDVSGPIREALTRLNIPIKQAPFALDQIYISHGPMKVNGVQLRPSGDHAVVLVPSDVGQVLSSVHDMVIASSSAGTDLGGIPLSHDATSSFESSFNDAVGSGAQQLIPKIDLDAIANDLKSKLDLGPFTLAGDAQVHIANGVAILDAEAKLPSLSTTPGGAPIEAGIHITGQPDGTVRLSGIHLHVPDAYLGAVHVEDLDLSYDGGLTVRGQLLFPPLDTGIDIQEFRIDSGGHFRSLILAYLAGAGEGIPVGPGVFLTKIGGGLTLSPDEIHALAAVSVGPSSGGGCPIAGLDGSLVLHFGPAPFFISTNADIELACFKIGNVHFYADSTGYVTFGGSMGFDGGPLYFNVSIDGAIRLPDWQLKGSGEGGIRHVLTGKVQVVISNHGLAGCGSIYVGVDPFGFTVSGGAGIRWNPSLLLGPASIIANLHLFVGCDLSDYETVVSPAAADAGRAGPHSFTVAPGQKALVLAVQGLGKAPLVKLRGPGGTTVDMTGAPVFTRTKTAIGVRQDSQATTFFIVAHPPAGRWSVTPGAGSVPIVKLQRAQVLPQPKITAHVSGTGSRRTLSYSVTPIAGQTVHFVEEDSRGGRPLVTVKGGGHGHLQFTVSTAHGSRRTIVAEVDQNDLPRTNLTVATFSAPSPKTGAARSLHLRRQGNRVLVTWKPAPLAVRYDVVVSLSTGARELFSATGRSERVIVPRVAKSTAVKVSVIGVSAQAVRGPSATARLAAVKPKRHRHHRHHRR